MINWNIRVVKAKGRRFRCKSQGSRKYVVEIDGKMFREMAIITMNLASMLLEIQIEW